MASQENGVGHTSILAVFANPQGTDPLRLGAETRVIEECLKLSKFRENINLEILPAATIHDVRRALLGGNYRIVHFSGHGAGRELVLENALGRPEVVPPEALAEFLWFYSPPIECVIFNACHTDAQGQLVSLGVPFTISMGGPISDAQATEFTRGFYDAIGAGKDIAFAFQEGCLCVKLTGLADGFKPVLLTETRPQEQVDIKIVSQHQVQFGEDEEEEGFLDYILDGTEGFEAVRDISTRMTSLITALGENVTQDTADLQSLTSGPQNTAVVRRSREIVNHVAQNMEAFARQLDEDTPQFSDAYSKAIDYYGKAATLLATEFDTDETGQIEEALTVVGNLKDSMMSARSGLAVFRRNVSGLPRLTTKLSQAKQHCLTALDSFDRAIEAGLQLTAEIEALMGKLLT